MAMDGAGGSSKAGGRGEQRAKKSTPAKSFESLQMRPELLLAVENLGYVKMTEIQEKALPTALAGHDVFGKAKTGSGKTAVFGLALLQRLDLSISNRGGRAQALVLSPTRELATQVPLAPCCPRCHLRRQH